MKKNPTFGKNPEQSYSYYSRVLEKPFDTLEALAAAEAEHFEKIKIKEDAAAQKKNDAMVVENAFKDLNTARKTYKEELTQLTTEYANSLENLKNAYELGKKDIRATLANAEKTFNDALKAFTDKYGQYHHTLRDGDFETTISSQATDKLKGMSVDFTKLAEIFDAMFGI